MRSHANLNNYRYVHIQASFVTSEISIVIIKFYLALSHSAFAICGHYFESDCPFRILLEKNQICKIIYSISNLNSSSYSVKYFIFKVQ